MSNIRENSMESFSSFVAGLSLRQLFLLVLWLLSHFISKLADTATFLLWRLIERSFDDGAVSFFDSFNESESQASVSDCGDELAETREQVVGRLIPSLPDEIVEGRIWPALVCSPELLPLLSCISRHWRRFMAETPEWSALAVVTRGTSQSSECAPGCFNKPSFAQQWKDEVTNIRLMLSEDYNEIEARVRFAGFSVTAVPCYVSLEGCPPDAEECPGYYDL